MDDLDRINQIGLGVTQDPEFLAKKKQLEDLRAQDVTKGVGLSQGTLDLANRVGNRSTEDIANSLASGTAQAGGLINPEQSKQFNASLGSGNDEAMNSALQNRFQKNFAREAKSIKSNAMLNAQNMKSQNLATQQAALTQQQDLVRASKTRNAMKEQADKAQRNAVLGSVLGGAGAIVGTVLAPGVGTMIGSQAANVASGAVSGGGGGPSLGVNTSIPTADFA